jgi:hypothetical protein
MILLRHGPPGAKSLIPATKRLREGEALEAAIDFSRSEKAKSRKPSHKVQGRKRTLRENADELASAGLMTGAGQPHAAAAVTRMIKA